MQPNNQNNVYQGYSYLPSSSSISSQSAPRQYYDSRLYNQQAFYPYPTTAPAYSSSRLPQQRYQPLTTTTDLTEPISLFDDLKFPRYRQSNVNHFPPVYLPSNLTRRATVNDARLTTANAMRERLLIDIQHNMSEIDREITSLKQRSAISTYIPSRLSSFLSTRQTSLSNDDNQRWPNRPRKVYSVVSRIPSQSKQISPPLISSRTDQTTSPPYIGQYHYGPEMSENEIREGDPENIDLKLVANEIPKSTFRKPLTLDQFRREQSALSQHRALIFVPEYDDDNETGVNEKVEDFHQNHSITPDMARVSTVRSSTISRASHRIKIQDFQLLTHTAPEPKPEILPITTSKSPEVSDKTDANLINTMITVPVKHTRQSHSPPQKETKNSTKVDTAYFFSDFAREGEGEEDRISIDPSHFTIPSVLDILSDDNISDALIRLSQTSLSNPYSLQEQELTIPNNHENVKDEESKTIDAMTTHIITSNSTLPSKNLFPISIDDNMQTQFPRNNNNINQNQEQTLTTISNTETIERSSENQANNQLTTERKSSPKNMNSLRQRSTSVHQSPYILARGPSITSADLRKLSTQQAASVESHRNSPLPVPLNSPDLNNLRPSTSRPVTPERRNSISPLNQNILLTSIEINNLIDPSIDHFPMNSEYAISSPLLKLASLQESPIDMETIQPPVKYQLDHEEVFPPITAYQRHSRLPIPIQRSKPINNQKHISATTHISRRQMEESNHLKNWRERIDNILSKRSLPNDKYAHIKSRVNTFSNFEYQPKKFVVVSKRPLAKNDRNNTKEVSNKPSKLKKSTSQTFGRRNIFHEKLTGNVRSKFKSHSLENVNHKSRRHEIKIFNTKSRCHSESRVIELAASPLRRQMLSQAMSLPIIPDEDEPSFNEQESQTEMKIFDINFSGQQSLSECQEDLSWISKQSDKIFNAKLIWSKDINYHQPNRWIQQSKIQITHSLTLDIQSTVKYCTEIDLQQYQNLKWNDIITDNQYFFENENSNDQIDDKASKQNEWITE